MPQDHGGVAPLMVADLTLDNWRSPTVMELHIKQSKTDPYREGASFFLSKANKSICPVDAVVKYLLVQGKQNGPLFLWPNGTKLTRPIFASALATILIKLNQAGLQIKALGRWQSEAYQTFFKSASQHDQLSNFKC